MTRCRAKCAIRIAGVVLLLAAVIGAGVVYSWTFTPRGRLDLLFAVGLRLAGSLPPPGTIPVEEERAAMREGLLWWGDPKPLPRVEDRRIPGPDSEIPIRVYSPSRAARQPILVFYHGGGFRLGDLDSYDAICRDLAARSGAIIVSVGYRLAPEHVYPAAVDDSYAALAWVHAHAADIGGDATNGSPWPGDQAAIGATYAASRIELKARDLCHSLPSSFQLLKNDLGQYQAAIADLDRAIELNQAYSAAYTNRGIAKNGLGQHQAAIADHDRAIELNQAFIAAYNNRGIAKDDLGQHQAAIADYDRAIELNQAYALAYNNRGIAKKNLGRINEAREDYQKALDLAQEAGNEKVAIIAKRNLSRLDNNEEPRPQRQ